MTRRSRYSAPTWSIHPDQSLSWLKRAMPIIRAHRWPLITALAMSFIGLVIQLQIPALLNQAVSKSLQLRTTPLSHYVWLLVLAAILSQLASYVARLYLMRTAFGIEFDLRNRIFEHLSSLSFGFYDTVQTGQLISRANSDIRSVQGYLTFGPAIIVQCAIGLVAFAYMLAINVPLAFVSMITIPLVYISGVRMRQTMFPVSWLIQARLADVATIVDENINGVRVVKSFAAEPHELKELTKAADRLTWAYVKDADLRARYAPLMQNLPSLGLVILLVYGGYLVIHGQIGVGAILAFSAYIVMMQAPFQMIGMLVMMGQRAKASAERIYEIFDTAPSITDSVNAVALENCRGDVEFDNVSFAYNDDSPDVLHGFSLHLRPGETVAIVGRTGVGKSTVARLLPRFYDVTMGSVRVDGHDVRDLTLSSLRDNVGVVVDEPFLFSASIRENIAYARPDASIDEVVAAAKAAGAHEFIVDLPGQYDSVVGERGYTLSGGQRQRIAIARTLLLNPPILVLDDATSAVDVKTENAIHDALSDLLQDRTTLVIAHRLSTISLADRVVLLEDGAIVAEGTHSELLATSELYVEVLAQTVIPDEESDEAADSLTLDGVH